MSDVFVPVENFAEGDRVKVGKGKVVWRIVTVGREVMTLRPSLGKQSRVIYVENVDADERLKKVTS